MELKDLTQKIKNFNEDRKWDENIQPEDLAKSVVIEASELLEHFQWDSSRKQKGTEKPKDMEELGSEIADVLIYLIRLSYTLGFDLEDLTIKKIERNGKKYPIK